MSAHSTNSSRHLHLKTASTLLLITVVGLVGKFRFCIFYQTLKISPVFDSGEEKFACGCTGKTLRNDIPVYIQSQIAQQLVFWGGFVSVFVDCSQIYVKLKGIYLQISSALGPKGS